MGMSKTKLYRETLEAALAFHRLRLWTEFEDEDCFAVIVPGEEQPFVACILGQSGIEYGLNLVRGPGAAATMRELFSPSVSEREAFERIPILSFTIMRLAEIPPQRRKFLKKAKFECRRETLVPFFMAKNPGKRMRDPDAEETKKLLYVVKAILKAHANGMLVQHSILEVGDVPTLVVSGDPLDPEVRAEFRALAGGPAAPTTPVALAGPPPGLNKLPRLDARWFVAFPVIPMQVGRDDRTTRSVLVVDGETGFVVGLELVMGGDIGEAARLLFKIFEGGDSSDLRGLPSEIVFTSRELFDATAPALAGLDVKTVYDPFVPAIEEVVDSLREHLVSPVAAAAADVPAPDDLASWKAIDKRFIGLALEELETTGWNLKRAAIRYFGNDDQYSCHVPDEHRDFAMMCSQEWMVQDYRPTKRSKTVAERLLAGRLPEAARRLIEARLAAHPSIYKIEKIDQGLSLTCTDILLGGTVEVFDRGLAESGQEEVCLPMRVFRVGEFHFASPIGPPMTMHETTDAIEFLVDKGLKLDREGLEAGVNLFGRLWGHMAERRLAPPPRMVNFDGEDIEFHTATYKVTGERAAREAFAARPDVEQDEDDPNDYTLSGAPAVPQPGMKTVSLGRLLFVGDELLLEVNSAGRLDRARTWLDSVPGIKFEKVASRPIEQALAEDVPLDDKLGRSDLTMTPEIATYLEEHLRKYYFGWLDTPVPMFDGKTPREMAKTKAGRARVGAHIRGFPRGSDQIDMPVPVEEMLRELGIDEA
jgi:hypothetical protein